MNSRRVGRLPYEIETGTDLATLTECMVVVEAYPVVDREYPQELPLVL